MNPDSSAPANYSLISEIRHPLTNIILAIEMFELSTDDKEKELYIDIIKRNTARISGMVNKLPDSKQE